MTTKTSKASLAVAALVLSTSAALADIAGDTFGPGDSYSPQSFATFGGAGASGQLAVRILPGGASTIDRVVVALSSSSGSAVPVTISIYQDSAGTPSGAALWTSATQVVQNAGIYTFTGASTTLSGGQGYWVSAYAPATIPNAMRWHRGVPGVSGSTATGPSPWLISAGQTLPALRAQTESPTGACCNTGAPGVLGAGSGACAVTTSVACVLLGLRFDGAGTTCSTSSCRACPGDFNHNSVVNPQDIFDFLNAWFAGCP